MKVMLAVTHLLGTGHLSRALTLARAFRDDGHDVLLASGGMPAPHLDARGIEFVQLPPLRSNGTNFTTLLTATGTPVTDGERAQRVRVLEDTLGDFQPDALIVELFPFGRRILADEFMALLSAARRQTPAPVTLCSIRDILAPPSKPSKAQRADEIISAWFDAVLVHSDPSATQLDVSWPVSDTLRPFLRYTGYVAPTPAVIGAPGPGAGEVLVTAGGGSVGDRLFQIALQAAALDPNRRWRLLVGGSDREQRITKLAASVPANAAIEAARPDFRQMLYHAAASVSMCGYNTALDLLQAGTPAVLVPFDEGSEVEQTLRADSLAILPGITVLPDSELASDTLLTALETVIGATPRTTSGLRFDGASETVRLTQEMLEHRT